ncbi:hypothetical protein GCM10027034_27430 [Ramlibacter solisilvae]|uniref:DUF3016 domain-containing protein n=1 Tax=Ramlibacter tataouinensis TaxID=94132 RepID=A0A127JQZ7_9BURK|nr:DUF3016 domain-containing protein [Ramlibacter tataouinensis]AMO22396.1 hypothetical protein UC35_05135 [Ramlibacter tataouinensis]
MKSILRALALASIAASAAGAFAGTVQVTYVNPSQFDDVGNSPWDAQDNLKALARYMQDLGRDLLPANQTLRIEVLDVDLAGNTREPVRTGTRLRTLRGGADWPRINLRYVLEADGRQLSSGEEWVSDLDYIHGKIQRYRESEPLFYEKQMLKRWFRERFTGDPQAQSR